ncbi:MAG: hypothetical protein KF832_25480 [Caldilineaceae bacterium]|nr:hypothetical protein [Caldilineaceae bacterium]
MNILRNWRAYLPTKERLSLLLAIGGILLLALGIFLYLLLRIIPSVQTRSDLIEVVATMEQNAAEAATAQAAVPATVRAQVTAAQARVDSAASAFLSETQAAAALERLYQYAQESGVTIAELQAQAAPQPTSNNLYRQRTFGLRVTGSFPRLVNFLARIRETLISGFVVTNVDIAAGETNDVANMNLALYTSAYAVATATGSMTDVLPPPNLPPLPTDPPWPTATLDPGDLPALPTLPLTMTLIPTLAPNVTPTPIVIGPTPWPTAPVVLPTVTSGWTPLPPTSWPPTPLPTPPALCANLLGNGDFEGSGSWLIGASAKPPQYTNVQKYGGNWAMQLGHPPDTGVLAQPSYSSIRQAVTIPANANVVTLRWRHWYGSAESITGDPGTNHDRQEVLLLRMDEKVLTVLQRVRRNDSGWQAESIDLTPYRGQTVYLYFNVFNDGNGAATWAYIDEVQLDTCAGSTPVPTVATPVPTGVTVIPTIAPTTPAATVVPTQTPTTPTPPVPTPTATGVSSCPNLLANGDFEGEGSWILGKSALPPQYTTSQHDGGARAMQVGNPPAAGWADRASYSSVRQPIVIPADATSVTLQWRHLYGSSEAVPGDPGTSSDRQEVLLLAPDDRVLAVLQRVRRNDGNWQLATADLTAYRGQTVSLYFNVFNNGNGATTWAYLDNVELLSCVGGTPGPTPGTPTIIPTIVIPTIVVPTIAPTVSPTVALATPAPDLPVPSFDGCQEDPDPTLAQDLPIRILQIEKDTEIVHLQNTSNESINLGGWHLCSIRGNQEHDGILGIILPGSTLSFPHMGAGSVWNNEEKDDGALYNASGQLVSYWHDPTPP